MSYASQRVLNLICYREPDFGMSIDRRSCIVEWIEIRHLLFQIFQKLASENLLGDEYWERPPKFWANKVADKPKAPSSADSPVWTAIWGTSKASPQANPTKPRNMIIDAKLGSIVQVVIRSAHTDMIIERRSWMGDERDIVANMTRAEPLDKRSDVGASSDWQHHVTWLCGLYPRTAWK